MIQPPSQRDPIVDESGRATNVYQRWFSDLAKAIGSAVPPAPPAPEPPATGDHGTIQGLGSIQTFGVLPNIVQLSLEGDDVAPGQTFYYGTGQSADPEESHVARGWHPVSGAMEQGPGLSLTIGANGVTTFALDELPDAGGGTLQKTERDQYGRLAGTSEATTSDLAEGSNLYHTAERVDALITAQKAQPGGLATLDANAKLDAGQLPALAITETFVVNTEVAMLALDVQQGDVAVRSDLQKSFILTAEPASALSNWQELLVPTGVGVASFNGRTGTVIPQTGDYTPAQVGAATSAQGAKADSAVQGDDARLTNAREWTAATVAQDEAEAGAATTRRAWTAQRVRQAIAAWWAGSAAKTMLDGLVVQVIANGDTTHAPSGDAVFDAMAGKFDKTGGTVSGPVVRAAGNPGTGLSAEAYSAYTDNALGTASIRAVRGALSSSTGWLFRTKNSGADVDALFITFDGKVGIGAVPENFLFEVKGSDAGINLARTGGGEPFITLSNGSSATPGGQIRGLLTGGIRFTNQTSATEFWRMSPSLLPGTDNLYAVGSASKRPTELWAVAGAINTCDAREKTVRGPLNEQEIAAAQELASAAVIYQWKAAIAEKGEAARLHCSPTVQGVIAIMEAHGLDPFRYGFVCYDEWPEEQEVVESRPEERDEDGNVTREAGSEIVQEYRPAGDRYSLRPSELESFIAAGMAHRIAQLEARLAALESE